jgi:hypothetical protein
MFQKINKLQSIANEEKNNVGSTSHKAFSRCKFYPKIVLAYLKQ